MTNDPAIDRLRVRPYALTGGRVRSSVELALETIVLLTDNGRSAISAMSSERVSIAELADEPISIAEISAHLSIPLGVSRVLVGDMVGDGYLNTHLDDSASAQVGGRPDQRLLERVLNGLQAI